MCHSWSGAVNVLIHWFLLSSSREQRESLATPSGKSLYTVLVRSPGVDTKQNTNSSIWYRSACCRNAPEKFVFKVERDNKGLFFGDDLSVYAFVLQADTVRHRVWEDRVEACAQGAVEDRHEQPGEDHRPAAGPRYLRKLAIIVSCLCVCLTATSNRIETTIDFPPFSPPGSPDSVSGKGTGSAVQTQGITLASGLTACHWVFLWKRTHLSARCSAVQDHMAGDAKSLSPRQCAVMDVALDTIKVSLNCRF